MAISLRVPVGGNSTLRTSLPASTVPPVRSKVSRPSALTVKASSRKNTPPAALEDLEKEKKRARVQTKAGTATSNRKENKKTSAREAHGTRVTVRKIWARLDPKTGRMIEHLGPVDSRPAPPSGQPAQSPARPPISSKAPSGSRVPNTPTKGRYAGVPTLTTTSKKTGVKKARGTSRQTPTC